MEGSGSLLSPMRGGIRRAGRTGKKMSKNDVGSWNMHENKGKSGIMSAELSGLYT